MRVQRMKNTISAKNKYEPDAASAGQKEVLHEKERKDKCRTQRRSRKTYRRSPLLGDPQIGCLRHGAHAAPTKTNKCPTYGSWTDKKAAQNARLSSAFRRQIINGCRPRANRAPTGSVTPSSDARALLRVSPRTFPDTLLLCSSPCRTLPAICKGMGRGWEYTSLPRHMTASRTFCGICKA